MASCDGHFSFSCESALKTGGRKGNNGMRERLIVAVIPESSYMELSDLHLVHRFLTVICDNSLDFPATQLSISNVSNKKENTVYFLYINY